MALSNEAFKCFIDHIKDIFILCDLVKENEENESIEQSINENKRIKTIRMAN